MKALEQQQGHAHNREITHAQIRIDNNLSISVPNSPEVKQGAYAGIGCDWDSKCKASTFWGRDKDWRSVLPVPGDKINQPIPMGARILYAGPISKKSYPLGMIVTKRQLIVIDEPRVLYVDPVKMIIKGTIPWDSETWVEVKSKIKFHIHTSGKRTYFMKSLLAEAKLIARVISQLKAHDEQHHTSSSLT